MLFRVNLMKFFFPIDDHLFRLKKAEALKNLWKICGLLIFCSVVIYAWTALLGIGSGTISAEAISLTPFQYEAAKVWFVLGRMAFAVLFALLVLFIPSLVFYAFTDIPYKKLIVLQEVVLFVMLIERVLWIPLAVYGGMDWFVSPWSFGIIASYLTEVSWALFFFGAISLFQLWIIWFQVKCLSYLSAVRKRWIWLSVIGLHIFYWVLVAVLTFLDSHLISGWFA
ncbi:hypothetical protein [Lentibacillus salicampi]|uniref:Yip1 domain-containing protein n=1 Tax=Lentibacillus salicampi TaxID=175306 RepID=A0A4Y9A8Z7_9BACI|nr:hypothetical protein [Lentibacillus salicampi]TFJ91722.1 hypothetical protein E4U82_16150 [Lentibacillus salicampi]